MSNILQYESQVWKTADLLISSGIKQSDFPKFMMPFLALMMVESRVLRTINQVKSDYPELQGKDLAEEILDSGQGFNSYILEKNTTLAKICANDTSFETDFYSYLRGYDQETKTLLGVDASNEDEKYLNISGITGQLKKKKVLFAFAQAWSQIDLSPFDNSEITTLEEHVKRKWADISADTAGEQYTPSDIIDLISEIGFKHFENSQKSIITLYDPTCGGGNLLFRTEDYLKDTGKLTATYGQEWNDSLYALAKIESRFREDSHIGLGNTLTEPKHKDKEFDLVIANPPYGLSWDGFKAEITSDMTGRFKSLPAVSDSQLLFTQHILYHLNQTGLAVVVHNGSTLFSGDAGGGESEIRKYFFDNDWVEGIIQLPTDEFFNTNIYTYLWIFNKNKPEHKKDKVILINASEKFSLLKKNKGKKRKEINSEARKEISQTLINFQDTDFAKVFDKDYFYYNKQGLILTNLDEKNQSFENQLNGKKSLKLDPIKITQNELKIDKLEITDFDKNKFETLKDYYNQELKPLINTLDQNEGLEIETKEGTWKYDKDLNSTTLNNQPKGAGIIEVKVSYKKATKTQAEKITITAEITPDYQTDYEIIPYSRNEEENQKNIQEFLNKYITKPYTLTENKIGVEINFNKVFYKPVELKPTNEIEKELEKLNQELAGLEKELSS